MLKKLFGLAAALAALVAAPGWAQEAKDADPALWVVKDADTTIYLFGTVHVLKPGLSWFDEAVKAAFDKSDEVVLEMIEPAPAEMQALVMKTAISTTGPNLSDKLPEASRAALGKVAADLGTAPAALERFEPWFVALTASMAPLPKLGYDPESGAERTISAAAKAANKPLIGLETAEQQLGFLDTMPEDLQVKFLVSTLDSYDKSGAMLDKMVSNWSAGDAVALGETMNEALRETPEVGKLLLADRNVRWADWIAARMEKPGTVFVAVGAGHLAGSDSVQAQLAKHKLTAVRVEY
ncbi:MAG: TraB/GumN family protein [Sphingomonas sp.]|uniref:TraB/GumN family protein n=1 Tax=Sphingomonas sp. TaxID=28214 RepID=UPI0025EB82EC|nr:TraB/GumN family protein [Sphingomonas sp.]MBX3565858.1 TraB/GumN family protein [Sphingomonas sp.]